MTPVVLLTDGYLANGAEPWRIPDMDSLPRIPVKFHTDPATFQPYDRNEVLARPWAIPGTPGLEHRVGGLEKANITGNVSYDPMNHDAMCRLRAEKVARIADSLPATEILRRCRGRCVAGGLGRHHGCTARRPRRARPREGHSVGHVHLRHLNPLPKDLGDILKRYRKVLVPELNLGQLWMLLRARYLVDAVSINKIQGKPFKEFEIARAISSEHAGSKA
jgi:2-oxoglutarate ferredoxin oxidoreductase subunit alpha